MKIDNKQLKKAHLLMMKSQSKFKSKKHLQFVGGQPCCVCQSQSTIQVHHLLRPWDGVRGVGLKANDKNVIPLCFSHHNELHKRGNEESFFEEQGFSHYHGKGVARTLWYSSPANDSYQQGIEEQLLGWADQVLKDDEDGR